MQSSDGDIDVRATGIKYVSSQHRKSCSVCLEFGCVKGLTHSLHGPVRGRNGMYLAAEVGALIGLQAYDPSIA